MRTTVALLIALSYISTADAQNSSANKPAPKDELTDPAWFVPLTTWEKIKLGGAYFTNPQIVSAAPLAYTYDPKLFASEPSAGDLKMLEQKRVVVCGKTETTSIEVVPCPARPADATAASNEKIKIISATSMLLGKPADGIVKKVDEAPANAAR